MVSLAAFKTPDPPDEVGVQIGSSSLLGGLFGGSTYKFWHSIEIKRAIDTYSTVALTAPFEHDRKEFRDTFKPFSYNPVVVTIDDGTIFTGTLIDVDPQVGPDSSVVSATAYARPGVLADCCAPPDLWPLEFNKLKLRVIAEKLCKPFGFGVSVTGEQGAAFARVALDPEQKIQDFLAELAKLRNLVIADTPGGDLWFRKSVSTGSPVAKLKGQPLVSVKAQ